MLLWIAAVLVVLWAFGFFAHVAGMAVHLLIALAVFLLIVWLLTGRRL